MRMRRREQPADGRGDARFLTYTSSAWPKKRRGGRIRSNLDVRAGMGTHTEPQPEPAGLTGRPEGPTGASRDAWGRIRCESVSAFFPHI